MYKVQVSPEIITVNIWSLSLWPSRAIRESAIARWWSFPARELSTSGNLSIVAGYDLLLYKSLNTNPDDL